MANSEPQLDPKKQAANREKRRQQFLDHLESKLRDFEDKWQEIDKAPPAVTNDWKGAQNQWQDMMEGGEVPEDYQAPEEQDAGTQDQTEGGKGIVERGRELYDKGKDFAQKIAKPKAPVEKGAELGGKGASGAAGKAAGGAAAKTGEQAAGKAAGQVAGKAATAVGGKAAGAAAGTALGGPVGTIAGLVIGEALGKVLENKQVQTGIKWTFTGSCIAWIVSWTFIGLILFTIFTPWIRENKSQGGISPAQSFDAAKEEHADLVEMIKCLYDTQTTDDPDNEEASVGVTLTKECREQIAQYIQASKDLIEIYKKSLEKYQDHEKYSDAQEKLSKMAEQVNSLEGVFSSGVLTKIRPYVDELERLRKSYTAFAAEIFAACTSGTLSSYATSSAPNAAGMVQFKADGSLFTRFGGTSTAWQYAHPAMVCYLVNVANQLQTELGVKLEVGDISDVNGNTPCCNSEGNPRHRTHQDGVYADIAIDGTMTAFGFNESKAVKAAEILLNFGAVQLLADSPGGSKLQNMTGVVSPRADHADHWHVQIDPQ